MEIGQADDEPHIPSACSVPPQESPSQAEEIEAPEPTDPVASTTQGDEPVPEDMSLGHDADIEAPGEIEASAETEDVEIDAVEKDAPSEPHEIDTIAQDDIPPEESEEPAPADPEAAPEEDIKPVEEEKVDNDPEEISP